MFYPGDDTPVCTKQLNSYSSDLDEFESLNAQVLGISAQSVESHEMFCRQAGPQVPAAVRHRQGRRRAVRHARPARLSAPQRVHRRQRTASSGTPIERSPGLTYRPVSELVEVLRLAVTAVIQAVRSGGTLGTTVRTCVRRAARAWASTPASPGADTPCSTAPSPGTAKALSLGVLRTPPTDALPQRLAALQAEIVALLARVPSRRRRRRAGLLPGQRAHGDERRSGQRAGARRGGGVRLRGRAVHARTR